MTLTDAISFKDLKLKEDHKSDGCTLAPDFWIKECCQVHDMLIRFRKVSPWRADWIYFLLMCRKVFPLAPVYYIAVSLRTVFVQIK